MANATEVKRVALYARVSTLKERDGRVQSPDMQLEELRAMAAQRGWVVVAEYVDRGESGAKDRRPDLDKCMAHVRRGGIDALLVWKFDRFARSVQHLVRTLAELDGAGVGFVSAKDGVDTRSHQGRLMFHIIAAIAEFEREMIRERVIAGVASARRKGKRLGRPTAEMRRTKGKRPSLDVDEVKRLLASGLSQRKVASQLGVARDTLKAAVARSAAE